MIHWVKEPTPSVPSSKSRCSDLNFSRPRECFSGAEFVKDFYTRELCHILYNKMGMEITKIMFLFDNSLM